MTDEEQYHPLFNAITDALEAMEKQNFGEAKALLIAAQQQTEEGYLRRGEESSAIPASRSFPLSGMRGRN